MTAGTDLVALGRFVRERRKELELTQVALGLRVGWAQERVSLLENGKYGMPSLPQLCRLADGLMLSTGELLSQAGFHGVQGLERPNQDAPSMVQLRGLSDRLDTAFDQM